MVALWASQLSFVTAAVGKDSAGNFMDCDENAAFAVSGGEEYKYVVLTLTGG